jgi:acyl-ACP thioesterase
MKSKVGKYPFMAEPFHCDYAGRLFMSHLGNHLINAADFHSNDRGFGMLYLNTIHKTWVLSRLAIELDEMPPAYTKFNVETWVESAMRFFTNRNFRISLAPEAKSKAEEPRAESKESAACVNSESPKVFGYGRSVWAMIDTETRQPTDIYDIDNGAIDQWIVKDKECPIDKGGRVKMSDQAELVRTIDTYYNDVDINGHINSVKYIEHVLDLWPLEWYRTHAVKRFEIAYVAEAHAGDQLSFYRETDAGSSEGGEVECSVRIVRTDGTECCRSKVTFVEMKS